MSSLMLPDLAESGAATATGAPRRAAILVSARQIASRERVFLATAELLAQRDWQVTVLAAQPGTELRANVRPPLQLFDVDPTRAWGLPIRLPHVCRLYASAPAVAKFLAETQPDVLLATSIPPNLVALVARLLSRQNTRVVIRQSNVVRTRGNSGYIGVARRPRDWLMPLLYPKADAIIAVSHGVAENLKTLAVVEPSRIHVIPNAVAVAEVTRMAREPVLHPWLRPDGPSVVVAVGRLVRKKDYPTLLRAFARVRRQLAARLIVLGEGPERHRLERVIAQLGIADCVDLLGHVSNPFAFMAHASLLASSSRSEGMPSALIEALACGCPVVSTDCPSGPAEILDGGRFGRLVPVGNESRLADAIVQTLLVPPDRPLLMARAADFALEHAAERYVEILTACADQPR